MFNHKETNTLTACGVTPTDMQSAASKLVKEIQNEPFEPLTATEKIAILVLATTGDNAILANTLNFADSSIMDNVNSQSEIVEALQKYQPTAEQIINTMALRQLSLLMED